MKPEHSVCRVCGVRIARLSDRERWHHYGGRWSGHPAEPMIEEVARVILEAKRHG